MKNHEDTDCNQVAYWPQYPDYTERCTQPEGHGRSCWLRNPERMGPKHRRPVQSFMDPFELVPVGGRHRRPVVAAVARGEVRRPLAAASAAAVAR